MKTIVSGMSTGSNRRLQRQHRAKHKHVHTQERLTHQQSATRQHARIPFKSKDKSRTNVHKRAKALIKKDGENVTCPIGHATPSPSLKRRLPGCHRKPGQASLGPTLVEGPLKLRSALVADPLKLRPKDSMGPLKGPTDSTGLLKPLVATH